MGQYKQKSNGKGSLKDIQLLINQSSNLLEEAFINQLQLSQNTKFKWLSPLVNDEYKEYRDDDFIKLLEIDSLKVALSDFWPRLGPQWDGLCKCEEKVLLIEAKANIPEILSPATSATGNSLKQIESSLSEVKRFIGSKSSADWSKHFYQYTNRLAHLYFLREINNIPTYLIFIYFIGDKTVNGPDTIEEWKGALKLMKQYLGIDKNHKLSPYIIDIFINVDKL
jgi:hypothetical protein